MKSTKEEMNALSLRVANLSSQVKQLKSLFVVTLILALIAFGSVYYSNLNMRGSLDTTNEAISQIESSISTIEGNQQAVVGAITDIIGAIQYIAVEANISAPRDSTGQVESQNS